jgi:hypothetical protein
MKDHAIRDTPKKKYQLVRFMNDYPPLTLIVFINKAGGVASMAVHMAKASGDTTVREEDNSLVQALRNKRPEVPPHNLRSSRFSGGDTPSAGTGG